VRAGPPGARARRRLRGRQPRRRRHPGHRHAAEGAGVRLILAEDSVLLREGLASLLQDAGHEVVAAVGDAPALIEAVAAHRPDVAVVDVRMPPTHTDDGLRAALRIRESWPEVGVLVLAPYAAQLLAGSGERLGYLLKDRVSEVAEFLGSLERVHAGGTVIDPEVVRRLLARARRADPLSRLTGREREVLHRLAQGYANGAIA